MFVCFVLCYFVRSFVCVGLFVRVFDGPFVSCFLRVLVCLFVRVLVLSSGCLLACVFVGLYVRAFLSLLV